MQIQKVLSEGSNFDFFFEGEMGLMRGGRSHIPLYAAIICLTAKCHFNAVFADGLIWPDIECLLCSLGIRTSIAIILMGKRELVALLNLSSWCLVMVERLFLAVPWCCLRFVIS